jgi:two-component system, chemotaxis family, protein-glutamate methylesterase/glutaminase
MSFIKVLIVDDSAVVRQVYKSLLESDPGIQVVGTASDPYIAAQKIQKEKPDVITLDIEMPRMDGLTFLKKIMAQAPMPVVVISNQTLHGADIALKALEAGATDVMAKPNVSNEAEMIESRITLIDKIRSAYYARPGTTRIVSENMSAADRLAIRSKRHITGSCPFLVAVGASTGGTEAIRTLLSALPEQMPPIMVVQHMPEKFTTSFAKRLNEVCMMRVKEAEDGEVVLPGNVYIAPGGQHMAIQNVQGRTQVRIFTDALVNRHRPSVNVLFNSVAEVKAQNSIGIILTGMGDDGATGMMAMHKRGAFTIAQDEATSVVYGMPQKALLTGGVSTVLPLGQIAAELCRSVNC